ncbi:MAG: peptide deformylase [Anaerovoracaceae bacterium]|jgi:peptide deformylase
MALRNIVKEGDPILTKKCREVEDVNDKIRQLLDDMLETMRSENGVGIAAPQVGMLKRMCIVEPEEGSPLELINPIILEEQGEQEGYEGCLSVPGYIGSVKRPERIKVRALTRRGGQETYEFTGFEAVVVSHELDHLEGVVYTSKAKDIHRPEVEEEKGEEQ